MRFVRVVFVDDTFSMYSAVMLALPYLFSLEICVICSGLPDYENRVLKSNGYCLLECTL